MRDLIIYRPDWKFRFSYNSFHRSEPFLGLTYHQLCIGPFVIEWNTHKRTNKPWH